LHPPTRQAFEHLQGLLGPAETRRLVLDSGCGTADSTRLLAQRHADAVVIGIDRSAARLARSGVSTWPTRQGNKVLLRAELASFWRLAAAAGWRLQAHYLLYPNPWPKSGQLLRRWHAHPVWPGLLALGGQLEMRCNWEVYAREFAAAISLCSDAGVRLETLLEPEGLSPFERKYAASGHRLFAVRADLRGHARLLSSRLL
jgi:tRNA G46 methylase TrmB